MGFAWVPNANEIHTKNMKCTRPTPAFCVGTQRNLYSTDWLRGLASGKTQILALGNAKIYQHIGISNAKFWHRGHCPTPTPDARYFASQWNIGLYFKIMKLFSQNVIIMSVKKEIEVFPTQRPLCFLIQCKPQNASYDTKAYA